MRRMKTGHTEREEKTKWQNDSTLKRLEAKDKQIACIWSGNRDHFL